MIKVLTNYKRAKKLLEMDDQRIKQEQIKEKKQAKINYELSGLSSSAITYLERISKIRVNSKLNLIATYRELNRIRLSLFVTAPSLYRDFFEPRTLSFFDTVYIKDYTGKMKEYSLEVLESEIANSDYIKNVFRDAIVTDLLSLRNFVNFANRYSN